MKIIVLLFLIFTNIEALEVQDFFKKKIIFNSSGIPIIRIGISETKEPVILKLLKDYQFKDLKAKKDEILTINYKITDRGEYTLWLILAKYPYKTVVDVNIYNKYLSHFLKKNKKVKVINVGNLSVVNGNIIDIRKQLLIFGPFKDEKEAEKIKLQLYLDFRLKSEFYAEVKTYPKSKIFLTSNNKTISFDNYLELNGDDFELKNLEWGINKKRKIDLQLRGKLFFTPNLKGELTVLNQLNLEELLKGIVPSEIFASAHIEALKAQAVAARTDILAKIGTRHFESPYQVCGNQHCQVYKGKIKEHKRTNRAIWLTHGEVLKDKDGLIDAYYSANSGGHTENNENVWLSRKRISLRGRDDFINWEESGKFMIGINENNIRDFIDHPPKTYSSENSFARKNVFRWKKKFTSYRLQIFVNNYFEKYKLNKKCKFKDLIGKGRGVSGRFMTILIKCKNPKNDFAIYGELQIRRFLRNLKSSMFYMNKRYNKNKQLTSISFIGGGWGHGVGMCQTGAIGMAEHNKSYKDILKHYYTDSELKKLY